MARAELFRSARRSFQRVPGIYGPKEVPMYCPKCGYQQPSDAFRFCSRCGLQLGSVKELIAPGDATSTGEPRPQSGLSPLRQIDINIGAGVMLFGAIKSALIASLSRGPGDESIILGLLAFSAGFAVLLLIFQLSPRQRGLTLGATLMFVGSLVAAVASGPFGLAGIAAVAAFLIPLVLFWRCLSGAFMREFFDQKPATAKGEAGLPGDKPVLIEAAPVQGVYNAPVRAGDTDSELKLSASSVTENTTELLSN